MLHLAARVRRLEVLERLVERRPRRSGVVRDQHIHLQADRFQADHGPVRGAGEADEHELLRELRVEAVATADERAVGDGLHDRMEGVEGTRRDALGFGEFGEPRPIGVDQRERRCGPHRGHHLLLGAGRREVDLHGDHAGVHQRRHELRARERPLGTADVDRAVEVARPPVLGDRPERAAVLRVLHALGHLLGGRRLRRGRTAFRRLRRRSEQQRSDQGGQGGGADHAVSFLGGRGRFEH